MSNVGDRNLRLLESQVRELRCLKRISALLRERDAQIGALLPKIVELIPTAYQYPDVARARILRGDAVYASPGFRETSWEHAATIATLSSKFGTIQVCYLEERPREAEGPFLEEERELIDTIAEQLGERIEQENTAQQLRLNETRLQTILDSAPVILWAADRDGTLTLARGRMLARLGLDPGSILGRPLEAFLGRRPEIRAHIGRALAGEHVVADARLRGLVFELRVSPAAGDEGTVAGVIGVLTDITERVTAANELKKANRLLEEVVSSMSFHIAFLDSELRIIRVNRAFARLIGRDPAQLAGAPLASVIPGPRDEKAYARVMSTGVPYSVQEQAITFADRPGGPPAFMDMDIMPLGSTLPADGLVVILVDRTLKRQAMLELERSRAELERLAIHLQDLREEERRHVAREIHDELGGLLTALKMDLSVAEAAVASNAPSRSAARASAENLIDQAIVKVRDIAASLRPQALDDLGLLPAVENLVAEFRRRAKIRCDLAISDSGLTLDKELATAVFRILQEALTNVARHAKATRVGIALRRDGDTLTLRVADNGRGLPGAADASTQTFGILGMRERVSHLGGAMKIHSGRSRGTVLLVRLPLTREAPDNAAHHAL